MIEPKAFEHLTNLKWISFSENKIRTLSYKLFENNPHLIYISFYSNQIDSIHPNFFDGLEELKWVDFERNVCINKDLGCETCKQTKEDLNSELENCYANCKEGTICHNSYLDPVILQYLVEKVDQVKEDQESAESNYQNMKKVALFLIFLFIFLIAICFLSCKVLYWI